jgi:hypothetical protein
MSSTTITREQLADILDTAELYEAIDTDEPELARVSVRADYSGRGMYGTKCLGFTVSAHAASMRIAVAMGAVLGTDEAREIVSHAATDSMSRDMIVYFPGLTLSD